MRRIVDFFFFQIKIIYKQEWQIGVVVMDGLIVKQGKDEHLDYLLSDFYF